MSADIIAGIIDTGPPPPSILECLGLPDAELPDPELGQAESAADDGDDDFFLLDFPDSQMEMEWRRWRPAGPPSGEEAACGDGPHTRSFNTARVGRMDNVRYESVWCKPIACSASSLHGGTSKRTFYLA